MKNILISSSAAPDSGSGVSTYAREISENLVLKGYKIYYLSPTPDDFSWLKNNDIIHIESSYSSNLLERCQYLVTYIKDKNIQGIINNDNPVLQSIAPAINCPIIAIGHLEKFTIASTATYNTEWIDYVVAISNDMQKTYIQKFGVPISKCPIVHNGVKQTNIVVSDNTDKALKLIFAGEFSKRKGADIIVKTILTNHPVWDQVELHWYGDIPEKIKLQLNKNSSVHIHGRVPRTELLDSLKSSDVFLMSSREEGCPMAMLEAMSYGVVPISSNGIGAMRWLIDHGIEGFICHINHWNEQALECLSLLATNRQQLKTLKQHVLDKFNSQFTVDHTTEKLLYLLQNPTVDRSNAQSEIKVLRWHRFNPKVNKASFLDKVFWRLGILRFSGTLNLSSSNQRVVK